jgi:phage tail protein X
MPRTVISKQDDMVDALAYAAYGYRPGAVEAVFEANPGLCEYGPLLPAGLRIVLPDLAPSTGVRSPLRLWD